MGKVLQVVFKRPGQPSDIVEMIDDVHAICKMLECKEYESITERFYGTTFAVLTDREAETRELAENIASAYGPNYRGPIVAVGVKGEDFVSLEDRQAKAIARHFDRRSV